MQLATLPPRHLDAQEYEHRPRGVWVPPTSKGRAKVKEGGLAYTCPCWLPPNVCAH